MLVPIFVDFSSVYMYLRSVVLCVHVPQVGTVLCVHVYRLMIPSLKVKGTNWSTFAIYWGYNTDPITDVPRFLSDSY